MSRIYRCSDGYCGGSDCSRCFPGNEHEQAVLAAREEYEEQRADADHGDYDDYADYRSDAYSGCRQRNENRRRG